MQTLLGLPDTLCLRLNLTLPTQPDLTKISHSPGQTKHPLITHSLKATCMFVFLSVVATVSLLQSLVFSGPNYLQCEGSWSGPSGSWLGREPFMPKCTSERKHTGSVMGLKIELSKHFAYPHVCGINHNKIWISLSFEYSKILSCNCSWVLSYCLLASKKHHYLKPPQSLCIQACWFLSEDIFWRKIHQKIWNSNWKLCHVLVISIFLGVEGVCLLPLHNQPWRYNGKCK